MKKVALVFMLVCSFIIIGESQERGNGNRGKTGPKASTTLKGKVIDEETRAPLEYATLSAFSLRDSSLVGGGITDANGLFEIEIKSKRCRLSLEFLGYETKEWIPKLMPDQKVMDIGVVELQISSTLIENVEIRAEKSEMQFSLDKRIFNVGKDLSNKGGTAEDILDNVPSVSVDIDGNVSLRGSGNVKILIDGKPSGLVSSGNANGLRSIMSNAIEQVEVITNPSAKYEAEGSAGIINLVLKKNNDNGFNGSFDVTVGVPDIYGLGANLNYRKGKLNWFANYGIRNRRTEGGGFNYQERLNNNTLFITDQDRDSDRGGLSNNVKFGVDYFFTEKEQLTLALDYQISDENNLNELFYKDYIYTNQNQLFKWNQENKDDNLDDANLISTLDRTDDEKEDEKNLEYSINYTKTFSSRDHKLTGLLKFDDRNEIEASNFSETLTVGGVQMETTEDQRSKNDEGNKTLLFQFDYSHPITKDHKWETGLRSSFRDITNNFLVENKIADEWFPITGLNNDFLYNEDIYASYFIYGNTINKFGFQAGLRAEYADIVTELSSIEQNEDNNRDYLDLFPSAHLNYKLTEKQSFQVSYSRRIQRPRFWDINPFFTFSDNRNFFSGNPFVDPQYTDSYELSSLSFFEHSNISASIFYRYTTQSLQRITNVDNLSGNTLRVPLNIGTEKNVGLDLNYSYRKFDWFRLDWNFSLFRNNLELDPSFVADEFFDYFVIVREYNGDRATFDSRYSFTVRSANSFSYTARMTTRLSFWDSDFQIRTNYRGPLETSQGTRKAVASLDLGWSKDFMKKKLTATISVRDLFNSRKRRGVADFDDFYYDSEFQWRGRMSSLTLSYRINQKKKRGPGGRSGSSDSEGGF